MAIRRMTSEGFAHLPNVETVRDYPGHETGVVNHWSDCPHRSEPRSKTKGENCGEHCFQYGPLYMETTHVGLVLSLGENNGYDDSDFYAIVWNPELGATERIEYATTRGWTYPNSAWVDATPEVQAAYEAYRARLAEERRVQLEMEEARTPRVGKSVMVMRGRKIPIGTVGVVFWAGADKFRTRLYENPNRWMLADVMILDAPERIGITLPDGGKVFIAAEAARVVADGDIHS
jgi:hypothetical protein